MVFKLIVASKTWWRSNGEKQLPSGAPGYPASSAGQTARILMGPEPNLSLSGSKNLTMSGERTGL
jgi:hypothetical protein